MSPALRKLNLTAHITASVGWLGAVAGFLALSIAGLTSQDPKIVQGVYLSMNLMGKFVIVPLGLAALLTGLIQSLGTPWGLFRHYWVIVKFILTVGAVVLLLLHQFTAVAGAARRASDTAVGTIPKVGTFGTQLVGDAGLAVLVLLVTTTLAIYKPWGKTRSWRQKERERSERPDSMPDSDSITAADGFPRGLKIFLAIVGMTIVVFAVFHLIGRGHGGHGM